MVLTAASTSYVASAAILPVLSGNGRNSGSFLLTINPSTLTILQGDSGLSTITLLSVNGFEGKVALSAISTDGSLTLAVQNNTLSVLAGGTVSTILTASVPSNATNGVHDVIVTGTGTGQKKTYSSSALLTVAVGSTANFAIHIDPSSIRNVAGSTNTTSITITSLNSFTGSITLTATIPFGFIAVMGGSNPILLPADGTASTSLQISTTTATQLGTYTVTVTGASSTNFYSESITVTVTPPTVEKIDLTSYFFASGTNLTVSLQNTGSVPLTLRAYSVRDSLGNAWTRTNWPGPTIDLNSNVSASLLISTSCLECTYTGIFGLFNQFATGRTYTIVLTAESGVEFTFTVTW